jgi:hypothetical protein
MQTLLHLSQMVTAQMPGLNETRDSFEAGPIGIAALVFFVSAIAVGVLFRLLMASKADHLAAVERLTSAHAAEMATLRAAKDEQLGTLTKATVEMVEKQTRILAEVNSSLSRVDRQLSNRGA